MVEDYGLKKPQRRSEKCGLGGFPHEQLFKREGAEERNKEISEIGEGETSSQVLLNGVAEFNNELYLFKFCIKHETPVEISALLRLQQYEIVTSSA